MRKAHYWKPAGAKLAPSEIIVFDTETVHGELARIWGGELQTLRLGCALAYRLENGKRTRVKRLTFRTAQEFWSFVESRLSRSRPLWVFAHNAAFDLGVVGCWKWLRRPGIATKKPSVSGQLFFIKCDVDGRTLNLCDTVNYYRLSLKKIGKAVGLPKMEMPAQEEPDSVWEEYCRNDVDVTAAAIDHLIAFNREHSLGPWQPTIAGLAFSAFRRKFMRDKILVHVYREPIQLERRAYYGGLVDTPFIGRAPARRVWELDVCSMYPSVCCLDLPTRIRNHSNRIGVAGLKRLAEKFLVCADVTIESFTDVYPVKCKQGTYHPLGRFRTALAHPELMEAIDRGHVKYVHYAVWYAKQPFFREYMQDFAAKKIAYHKPETEAFENLCKLFMTNLYGKTGQLTPKWLEWGPEAMELLEENYGLAPGTLVNSHTIPPDLYELEGTYLFREIAEPIQLRDYYGKVEVKVGEAESRDSCPIIAATVTSYARVKLREYQRIATPHHWFYSDTDSIWVDDEGRDRLNDAGCIRPGTLGYLDEKKCHDWLIVHGPKDYETDSVKKLKGIRAGVKPDERGGYTQLHFPSAAAQIRRGEANGVFVEYVTKRLSRKLTKAVHLPSGWTRPLVFPLENPDEQKKGKTRNAGR